MAIRIERDEPQMPRPDNNNNDNRGGGGSNILTKLLPFLLMIFFKKPKLGIAILLIGGGLYYFGALDGFIAPEQSQSELSTGSPYDEQKYDETNVFAALASDHKNSFPSQMSLLQYAPPRLNQGRQGSCVGWASAYSARSILHARATGEDPQSAAFSPAFLYNQIALTNCQGAYLMEALENMKGVGSLPFREFTYNETSCSTSPNSSQKRDASSYKIRGYNRLSKGGYNYKVDIEGIRQNIAQGAPVVIGMQVGGTFMTRMYGKADWKPTSSDKSLRGFSGHAMSVIGYDDNRNGGSFQIMNSWGDQWGDDGVAWVSYRDFEFFVKEAYGLSPMGKASVDENKLAVKFGIIDKESRKNIPLKRIKSNIYRTQIAKDQRFKLEVTNSLACNIYIVTEELDGSSTVLFPYEKYSPYCGIVGTRLFPNEQSLYPDQDGNLDRFAIIVTKEEIDINDVNKGIGNSSKSTFQGKILEALGTQHIESLSFNDGTGTIDFEGDLKGKNAVSIIIEVSK
ncbi:MAG: C1 family peptidase [Saprospiraceae bacterium]